MIERRGKKPREDLTGKQFSRLSVLRPAEDRVLKIGKHLTMWECKCNCGNTVIVRSCDLKSGKVMSCGCYRKETTRAIHTTHGATKGRKAKKLYSVWAGILARCNNPGSAEFQYYGGKGVTVCKGWENDYSAFEKWALTNGYEEGLSIDRIDVNGDYCPENCRWATDIEQANNKTTNKFLEAFGERHTIAEWARKLDVTYNSLYYSLSKNAWDLTKVVVGP